jgi:hypothetical protein
MIHRFGNSSEILHLLNELLTISGMGFVQGSNRQISGKI